MTPTDRDMQASDMPHDFIDPASDGYEFHERLHEHDEPDEGDGLGAIKWPFWIGLFYIAVFAICKFAGVI